LVPAPDSGDDLIWVGGPGEGLWSIIGFGDEAIDGGLKVDERVEDAAFQSPTSELGKEAFDRER
jgi:hypothetical protein